MKMNKNILKKLGKISLKTQLAILIVTTFSIIIVVIIAFNYHRNTKTIVTQQISIISNLLRLETQNMDTYLSEIDRYSLLLRHEQFFMQTISNKQPLSYEDATEIQTLLRSQFDSRNDLQSYRLYLVNKNINYEIDSKEHRVQSFVYEEINQLPNYDKFTVGKYYKYLVPGENSETFLTFYRTIIDIETRAPLAIVELTFDTSYINSLVEEINDKEELFCYIDEYNRLFYSSNHMIVNQRTIKEQLASIKQINKDEHTIQLNNQEYLMVNNKSLEYGYTLYHFKSISEIDKQLSSTRNISLIVSFISIIMTTLLAVLSIRVVTNPLSTLSHRLRGVGKGNFTTTIDVGGSPEISNIADDFNTMIFKIDELINKTYKSELNEKTARLIALEAQINPHFLYNTLQAISAEAIVNQQPRINYMVTALASIMRYSIKGGDFAKLSQEMKHVKDYLLLQQARFEDKLSYELFIEEDTLNCLIPKISIQTLVENSIIHGMKGQSDNVHIKIYSRIEDEALIISVIDDGYGISDKKREDLMKAFINSKTNHSKLSSIGLVNLYSRIQLLYANKATLDIESEINKITTMTLKIPKQEEIDNV